MAAVLSGTMVHRENGDMLQFSITASGSLGINDVYEPHYHVGAITEAAMAVLEELQNTFDDIQVFAPTSNTQGDQTGPGDQPGSRSDCLPIR